MFARMKKRVTKKRGIKYRCELLESVCVGRSSVPKYIRLLGSIYEDDLLDRNRVAEFIGNVDFELDLAEEVSPESHEDLLDSVRDKVAGKISALQKRASRNGPLDP